MWDYTEDFSAYMLVNVDIDYSKVYGEIIELVTGNKFGPKGECEVLGAEIVYGINDMVLKVRYNSDSGNSRDYIMNFLKKEMNALIENDEKIKKKVGEEVKNPIRATSTFMKVEV